MAPAPVSAQSPYESLRLQGQGDIRVVRILGNQNGAISCQLRTINLGDSPEYIALSYTWGPATDEDEAKGMTSSPTHQIMCNDSPMLVTENLHSFLLRAADNEDLMSKDIWIDIISINQEDSLERTNQVSQMATIYRSAAVVIIWLGEENESTDTVFALLRDLGRLSDDDLERVTPSAVLGGKPELLELLPGYDMESSWRALSHLFERRYFTRTWILQEVFLGRKRIAVCGGHSVDWDHVVKVSRHLTVSPWTRWIRNSRVTEVHHQVPNMIEATRRTRVNSAKNTLLFSLIRFRRFQASDPRDKVYALLGLLDESIKNSLRLRPTYGTQSVADTYTFAAIHILENTDHLLLLAHAEGRLPHLKEKLPSWVPDWRCSDVGGLGVTGYLRFAAAGNAPRSLYIDAKNLTLTLKGQRLDQIKHSAETKREILGGHPFPNLLSIICLLPATYCTGQSVFEVLWRSLITNTAGIAREYPAPDAWAHSFVEWYRDRLNRTASHLEPTLLARSSEILEQQLQEAAERKYTEVMDKDQYETVLGHAQYLRLFLTEQKFFGVGAELLQPGDSLWIVAGSRVPLILREADEGCFRIIGGAYVHGFMNGEALQHDKPWTDLLIV